MKHDIIVTADVHHCRVVRTFTANWGRWWFQILVQMQVVFVSFYGLPYLSGCSFKLGHESFLTNLSHFTKVSSIDAV